jgi:cystathionine gamma-synthase
MSEHDESWGHGTQAVWAGEGADYEGATVVPVFHGVTYAYDDLDQWADVSLGRKPGHVYSRNTNPTVQPFEDKMRALDGAEAATSFSTGMAAISNTLFALLSPGDRVVAIKDTYGGTSKLFLEFLPRFGIGVTLAETETGAVEQEVARGCRLLYLETPTNPTLKVLDIARLSEAARAVGATVVVDNTFATPVNQRPLELGADLAVYSATKYLGGHSDAMGGVLCGRRALVDRVFHFREINGASLHPMSAWLLLRGLKTLELRILRHNENGQRVAEYLAGHPRVDRVFYPGLPEHPDHHVARRQMRGFGGVLSFSLAGGFEAVRRVVPRLRLAHRAASLGSVGTLVGPPRTTSHVEVSAEERAALGIPESLVRYSVGIENAEDLIQDLGQALDDASGR